MCLIQEPSVVATRISAPGSRRRHRRTVIIILGGVSLLIVVVVGSLAATMNRGWSWSRTRTAPEPDQGHWAAVIRGRSLLDQNRPDLALREVADIRDARPGAGEAMCVAGVSLARMQQLRSARIALE